MLSSIEAGGLAVCKKFKKGKLIMNHRYMVEAEDGARLQVNNEWYPRAWFRADASLTCHSVQGDAIRERFIIMEADHFYATPEWFWTACTRATRASDVYIYCGTLLLKDLDYRIRNKLEGNAESDAAKGWECNLTADWVKQRMQYQNYCCDLCGRVMDMSYEDHDRAQWSIDRMNNDLGHVKGNCRLVHWECNRARH